MTNAREAVATELQRLFEEGFVVVDLETTGFPTQRRVEIIEVAILNHEGRMLLNTLVKPIGKIPPEASAVNGIYASDVAEAPPFTAVYPQLRELLHGQPVADYNFTFERGMFDRVCELHDLDPISPSLWYCPMRGYQRYKNRHRFTKLTSACSSEQIVVANAHRALGDCLMTLELMKKMAEPTEQSLQK
jgi:DNA polymerase-3 subunit epsilon